MNDSPSKQSECECDEQEPITLLVNIGQALPVTVIAYVNRLTLETFDDGQLELKHPLMIDVLEDGVILRPVFHLSDTQSSMLERYLVLGHATPSQGLLDMYHHVLNSESFQDDQSGNDLEAGEIGDTIPHPTCLTIH